MISGKTDSGFVFDIEEAVLDDMELLDELIELDNGNVLKIGATVEKILGKDGKKKLYDHVRNENGRVPAELISQELIAIFNAIGNAGKNY